MSDQMPVDPDNPEVAGETGQPAEPEAKPFFVVESGNPTPEDIAVLTVVLAAAASGDDDEPEPTPVSGWSSPSRRMRSIGLPGFGGWRAEYFPR